MSQFPFSLNTFQELKDFLDFKVDQYNRPGFIENDPICIPHQFKLKQDIEIMGFWASILAWGQRKTIINKCNELIVLMDGAPYDFILNHQDSDLKRFLNFKHRTFNETDTLYFIEFFRQHYKNYPSLENAFTGINLTNHFRDEYLEPMEVSEILETSSAPCYLGGLKVDSSIESIEKYLNSFRRYFFSLPEFPSRTKKHVSSPSQKSTCKRLNMFLRWMVRKDNCGVDFGLWNTIKPSMLICPCDVHVDRVARKLGLITRKQTDWITAVQLTENLSLFDVVDPVKYDFALFGLGIDERF
jgi:uncharacterized protein (TIGR02757 family)